VGPPPELNATVAVPSEGVSHLSYQEGEGLEVFKGRKNELKKEEPCYVWRKGWRTYSVELTDLAERQLHGKNVKKKKKKKKTLTG